MEVEAKPEDEATREAQSSVFGQAVTLDAIHDSELIKTVNRAKQLLNDLDEAEKDKTRLTGELKQSEKAYSSMEKSVAEGITTALKKKKEENPGFPGKKAARKQHRKRKNHRECPCRDRELCRKKKKASEKTA